jgi:hypothetical protein
MTRERRPAAGSAQHFRRIDHDLDYDMAQSLAQRIESRERSQLLAPSRAIRPYGLHPRSEPKDVAG